MENKSRGKREKGSEPFFQTFAISKVTVPGKRSLTPFPLTRRQQEIYAYLRDNAASFDHPPSYDELCRALGLTSRGSLHKHIQALIQAGLVEPLAGSHRGIRLVEQEPEDAGIPFLGTIAAGHPIEAVPQPEYLQVPDELLGSQPCYVLKVSGDSMIGEGILDGDYVVIEQRDSARNGEIVVALVNNEEVTLKHIEQRPGEVILHPANAGMESMTYAPEEVQIQGVLRGLLRSYR
jgi:repressor LexA